MARKKQFKSESKQLLNLMIHSIYTNKDIFLREILSNASDACDKAYFKSFTSGDAIDRDVLGIHIDVDKENRQIIILDNGIGMSAQELEDNLGVIAQSGSKAFKNAVEQEDTDIIGQFGVGFYSAFMVSKKIEVISKAMGSDEANSFTSEGVEGFVIDKAERMEHGSTIICTLMDDTDDEDYSKYLERYTITNLVKTYSDYIRYPIIMKNDEGTEETLNSMVPLWKRDKKDVSEAEYNQFYKDKFHDTDDPQKTIKLQVEGLPSFTALLYIPAHVPFNFYTQQYESGLQLYSHNVFIMEHCKELIPDYFRFVQGLVDSPDLNLNISREILQQDRQLQAIGAKVEKKIKSELDLMMKNDRPGYDKFWSNFGLQIKFGLYSSYGMKRDLLQDLLLFKSSLNDELVSLKEYVERMDEEQKAIYYISAASIEKAKSQPQAERVVQKGYEVLYLTDDVDEFVIQLLGNYAEKSFKSVNQGDLDLESAEEKEAIEKKNVESKDLLEQIKQELTGIVDDVKLSSRLVSYPVCLSSGEGVSLEMEKVLQQMPENGGAPKAQRILEVNPNHPIFAALEHLADNHPEKIGDYAKLLYDQACLIEGLPIDDAVEFSKRMSEVMVEATKI